MTEAELDACCAHLDSSLPLHIDLCCGSGSYVTAASARDETRSYLGLDFRQSSLKFAEMSAGNSESGRAAFLCVNCHQLAALARLLDRLFEQPVLLLGRARVHGLVRAHEAAVDAPLLAVAQEDDHRPQHAERPLAADAAETAGADGAAAEATAPPAKRQRAARVGARSTSSDTD